MLMTERDIGKEKSRVGGGKEFPEFVTEWAGSHLDLANPNDGIRGIAPVDIFRRAQGRAIVQSAQPLSVKSCIDTYPNFK